MAIWYGSFLHFGLAAILFRVCSLGRLYSAGGDDIGSLLGG